ncbi:hypothetical protein X275_01070 [Marinitoga sp. 1197]|uniref:hypothetical protein n=1 Tax=Marinitoga sp. 1197 TaxID=1428449 RepID=UPI00064100F3|nr:hypothetical protein [Marinitoga sp. 1197]AJW76941.1 hypothetical protein UF08_52 [Marinitoga camini virus 1]KLO24021.1 hypothetical protein X275_01070 [Marinitoga sp. 1197]
MLRFDQLISIFSELNPNNKEILYNFLVSQFSKREDEESKAFVELLKEAEEDLMDYDIEVKSYEKKPLYFTQDEIATMIGKTKRQVQRIIKELGIKPINPNRRPAYYDLNFFKDLYIPHIKSEKNGKYLDFSFGYPIENELPVIAELITSISSRKEIKDENEFYDENYFMILEHNSNSNEFDQKGGLENEEYKFFKYPINF